MQVEARSKMRRKRIEIPNSSLSSSYPNAAPNRYAIQWVREWDLECPEDPSFSEDDGDMPCPEEVSHTLSRYLFQIQSSVSDSNNVF